MSVHANSSIILQKYFVLYFWIYSFMFKLFKKTTKDKLTKNLLCSKRAMLRCLNVHLFSATTWYDVMRRVYPLLHWFYILSSNKKEFMESSAIIFASKRGPHGPSIIFPVLEYTLSIMWNAPNIMNMWSYWWGSADYIF